MYQRTRCLSAVSITLIVLVLGTLYSLSNSWGDLQGAILKSNLLFFLVKICVQFRKH